MNGLNSSYNSYFTIPFYQYHFFCFIDWWRRIISTVLMLLKFWLFTFNIYLGRIYHRGDSETESEDQETVDVEQGKLICCYFNNFNRKGATLVLFFIYIFRLKYLFIYYQHYRWLTYHLLEKVTKPSNKGFIVLEFVP